MNFWSVEDTFQYIDNIPDGYLLEFGVYNGNTLERLTKRKDFKFIIGFDSFEGLPSNNEGNPDWPAGAFNSTKDGGFLTPEITMDVIRKRVNKKNLELVKGFFDQTLTHNLGDILHDSASYIHLDCDLYSSTKTCLDWIFKYKVAKPGCLFRYDDWYGFSAIGGQRAAHEISVNKYSVNFQQIADNVFIYEGKN